MNKLRITHSPHHWPPLIPRFRPSSSVGLMWKIGSSLVVPTVSVLSKIWCGWLNQTTIHNHDVFLHTLDKHYRKKTNPLITICNHSSCLDDPLLWGALFPWKWQLNAFRQRWSAAADDICFTQRWHTLFFSLGRSVPVCRGAGIYQPSVEFLLHLLAEKQFIHVFPQAKVCEEELDEELVRLRKGTLQKNQVNLNDQSDQNKSYALKWGLARLILDTLSDTGCAVYVLPFFHLGMEKVLPNTKPYIPQIGKRVTVTIRPDGPIKFSPAFVDALCKGCETASQRRMALMQYLEDEMRLLKLRTMEKHFNEPLIN